MNTSWYFTAPWDPVMIRRGDALGFRAGADYFADLLAPGVSNATSDARWISLLSWCMKWSHVVWQKAGGGDLSTSDGQHARYAWMRPLELLWVDRALESGQTTGQLRGRRSVERWRNAERKPPNFAMSPDQFRRYRQVGTYGAYRVIFRAMPELTMGDGWTPADTALQLAALVNERLPSDAQLQDKTFENGTKWGIWSQGRHSEYWERQGWSGWKQRDRTGWGLLPTPDENIGSTLLKDELKLLRPVLFGTCSTRRATAEALAGANGASSHADLCDVLASSSALSKTIGQRAPLAPLPAFTRLADSAMEAMRGVWEALNHDAEQQSVELTKLASNNKDRLDQLRKAAEDWNQVQGIDDFTNKHVVNSLAEAMKKADTPNKQLRALTAHHAQYGGGRHWFSEQAGKLRPEVKDTGIAASNYRFRLQALARLAAQCGVADMNGALNVLSSHRSDDEGGDAL